MDNGTIGIVFGSLTPPEELTLEYAPPEPPELRIGAVNERALRAAVGFFLKAEAHTALVGQSRYGVQIRKRVADLGEWEPLVVDDDWIDEFAAAGNPDDVRDKLRRLLAAGADSLGLWLFPPDHLTGQLHSIATDVLGAAPSGNCC